MAHSAPGHYTTDDKKLILASTDWRWKIILVHFPDNRTYPFPVRAQPLLSITNPILASEITYEGFMDRLRQDGGVANNDQSLSRVHYIDQIFGNQYNLADQSQFLEALTMHEYDPEFSTNPMNIYGKDK